MAGLDNEESPFVSASQLPVTKGQYYYSQPKSSTPYSESTASRLLPRPTKPLTKTNGYLGDISSTNKVTTSGFSGGTFSVPSTAGDPTMKGQYDSVYDPTEQAKRDELYERILQETSNVFGHNRPNILEAMGKIQGEIMRNDSGTKQGQTIHDDSGSKQGEVIHPDKDTKQPGKSNEDNLNVDNVDTKTKEWSKKLGEEIVFDASEVDDSPRPSRPVPQPRARTSSEDEADNVQNRKPTDEPKSRLPAGPREEPVGGTGGSRAGSRLTDYNYSMDSFEQSYLSERGEVVRFDGDFDTYGSSPSPPPQVIDSEDNDF